MPGDIRMLDIFRMLDECAPIHPGHKKREATHSIQVSAPDGNGRWFNAELERGAHRKLDRRTVRMGSVRVFARKLGILDCAKRVLGL